MRSDLNVRDNIFSLLLSKSLDLLSGLLCI